MTRRFRIPLHLVTAALAMAVLAACSSEDPAASRELSISGPEDGAVYNAEQVTDVAVEVVASLAPDSDEDAEASAVLHLDDVRLLLGEEDITDAAERVHVTRLRWEPDDLPDGEHTLAVVRVPHADPTDEEGTADDGDGNGGGSDAADGESDGSDAEVADVDPASALDEDADTDAELLRSWTFTVDKTAPELDVTAPESGLVAGEPVQLSGTTEPGAVVTVGEVEVTASEDGSFEVELDSPPEGTLALAATDAAGNRTSDEVGGFVVVPSRATVDELRSVHVSFCAWASPELKGAVMDSIEAGRITAVQLDLKDETGTIGFATANELAQRVGSNQPPCRIDLEAAVAELHTLGVPVIGRIVAFADPVLVPWAWANDERDYAIQTADGSDFYTGRYNGFANFANPDIQEYNISIAEEAAAMGVDHILWDYLRKPDGPVENMTIPGLEGSVEDEIVAFTTAADERLAPYGIQHGASLYGVSADRPWEVGQDVERLAEVLDYVAPMIYPSHWGPGEYDVADPLMQPYDMVAATLEVWQEVTEGKRARVKPWLEDSNWPIRLGYPDRARYVREQIQATYDAGIDEWLLWDSAVRYTDAAMIQP
ncbi:MAG: putative glycoside hydrolase [Nitriliruptoraceae bacterium]